MGGRIAMGASKEIYIIPVFDVVFQKIFVQGTVWYRFSLFVEKYPTELPDIGKIGREFSGGHQFLECRIDIPDGSLEIQHQGGHGRKFQQGT